MAVASRASGGWRCQGLMSHDKGPPDWQCQAAARSCSGQVDDNHASAIARRCGELSERWLDYFDLILGLATQSNCFDLLRLSSLCSFGLL